MNWGESAGSCLVRIVPAEEGDEGGVLETTGMHTSGWPSERTVEKSSNARARRVAILTGANVRQLGSSRRRSLVLPLQDISPPPLVARGAELSR